MLPGSLIPRESMLARAHAGPLVAVPVQWLLAAGLAAGLAVNPAQAAAGLTSHAIRWARPAFAVHIGTGTAAIADTPTGGRAA